MSHLSGYCDCGRKMHFPKGASHGDTWTCWKCGKTWYIGNHGDPLHNTRSRAPESGGGSSEGGGFGCGLIILLFIFASIFG